MTTIEPGQVWAKRKYQGLTALSYIVDTVDDPYVYCRRADTHRRRRLLLTTLERSYRLTGRMRTLESRWTAQDGAP
ncbi:MAG TPA: hypothetical protein VEB22_00665 [Phycisphaerales bacterium]|nr:hypothetical protein [Phycisphaerales bacterium]